MLSAFNDRDNVVRALDHGALGFISKTSSRDVLLGALRLILAGGVYIPPEILGAAPRPDQRGAGRASSRLPDARPSPAELGLTERQVDVLALMMQGKSNKLICRALDLAEPTVKNHVSAILKALKVSNRTEAVLAVAALGWELPTTGQVSRLAPAAARRAGLQQPRHHRAQRHRADRLVQQVMAGAFASSSRSGEMSPLIRKAGIGRRAARASLAMASMPVSPSWRRQSEMMRSGVLPSSFQRLLSGLGGEHAATPAAPAGRRMASSTSTSSSITTTTCRAADRPAT